MKSKEYHLNRIKELEFQRDVKINQDNRTHATLIALLSIVVIFFIFELQNPRLMYLLGWIFSIFVLIFGINLKNYYPENKKIQNEFDIISGHKK